MKAPLSFVLLAGLCAAINPIDSLASDATPSTIDMPSGEVRLLMEEEVYYIDGSNISVVIESNPDSQTFEILDVAGSSNYNLPTGVYTGDLFIEWLTSAAGGDAELVFVPPNGVSLSAELVQASGVSVYENPANEFAVDYWGASGASADFELSSSTPNAPKPKLILLPRPQGGS